ncbi:MAG: hypothetical protein KAS32_16775, partial [Candidatus Peribacteraceae bacterium]|nr:hypothetical protein [Candidatus Peribacteraceae bacterium]
DYGYGFGLEVGDNAWDTDPASGVGQPVPEARDLLEEIELYTNSIRGVAVDVGYRAEFNLLIGFIESIGTTSFETWETKAFDPPEAVFTEDYYRLIDEISLCSENITQIERMAIKGLAVLLEKMLETTTPTSN